MALRDALLLSCLLLLVLPSPGSCVMAKAVNEEGYLDVEASSTTGLLGAAAFAPLGASPRKEHAVPPMESTRRSPGPRPGAAQQVMALWGSQGSVGPGASATKTLSGRGAPSQRLQSPNLPIFSCGGCTWIADSPFDNYPNCRTLRMVGAPDCGSGCPTILAFPGVLSYTSCPTGSSDGGIDAGAFKTTGLGHVTQLYVSGNQQNGNIMSPPPGLPAGVFDQLTGLTGL